MDWLKCHDFGNSYSNFGRNLFNLEWIAREGVGGGGRGNKVKKVWGYQCNCIIISCSAKIEWDQKRGQKLSHFDLKSWVTALAEQMQTSKKVQTLNKYRTLNKYKYKGANFLASFQVVLPYIKIIWLTPADCCLKWQRESRQQSKSGSQFKRKKKGDFFLKKKYIYIYIYTSKGNWGSQSGIKVNFF